MMADAVLARLRRPGRRTRWICLVATAAVAAGALQAHRLAAERRRAAQLAPDLDRWYAGFRADQLALRRERAAGRLAIDALESQLAAIRSRIVELDALAEGMLRDDEADEADFAFSAEPGVGGPQEDDEAPSAEPELPLGRSAETLSRHVADRWRQLHVLEDLIQRRDLHAAILPSGRPVAGGYVSSAFGARIDPFTGRRASHYGMDFAARRGTPVIAVAAGIVTWAGPRGGYGNLVEVDHGDGRVTRYGHNSEVLVRVGELVTRGETIARLGSTGRATGPNLHFEVRIGGKPVDPRPFLKDGALARPRADPRGSPLPSPGQVAEAETHRNGHP